MSIGRILVLIVQLCILTYKMFSSSFPQGFNSPFHFSLGIAFTFQPFKVFHFFHFQTILMVSLSFGLPVYNQLSSFYPALARHWQASKGLNKNMTILSDLELPALPYVAPITAISYDRVAARISIETTCTISSSDLVGR